MVAKCYANWQSAAPRQGKGSVWNASTIITSILRLRRRRGLGAGRSGGRRRRQYNRRRRSRRARPGCALVGVVAPVGVVAEVGVEIAVRVDGDTEDTGTSAGADVTRRWLAFPCACHCTSPAQVNTAPHPTRSLQGAATPVAAFPHRGPLRRPHSHIYSHFPGRSSPRSIIVALAFALLGSSRRRPYGKSDGDSIKLSIDTEGRQGLERTHKLELRYRADTASGHGEGQLPGRTGKRSVRSCCSCVDSQLGILPVFHCLHFVEYSTRFALARLHILDKYSASLGASKHTGATAVNIDRILTALRMTDDSEEVDGGGTVRGLHV
jgi:hypothetical protein